ncbi:MAG: TetR family transcriptional regulator [Acetobacteraceae bacterium]|nr:TetR family transcriptional regulator [Acetobacteraceae bacterium]
MSEQEFDTALVTAALAIAGDEGWRRTTVLAAAQAAGLSLPRARGRFRGRLSILQRFSQIVDQTALTAVSKDGSMRDRLFDLLMRRFDALQTNRSGVLAILQALPSDPEAALLLACETRNSMRWMLQAAGVATAGLGGALRIRGLMIVWLYALRAWQRDESADLSTTMAAVDTALQRAEATARWLHQPRASATVRLSPADGADDAGNVSCEAAPNVATDIPPHSPDALR